MPSKTFGAPGNLDRAARGFLLALLFSSVALAGPVDDLQSFLASPNRAASDVPAHVNTAAQADPDATAQCLTRFATSAQGADVALAQTSLRAYAATRLAQGLPATETWLAAITPWSTRALALDATLLELGYDPRLPAFARWLATTQPPADARALLARAAAAFTRVNPLEAFPWADALPDPAVRHQALCTVFRHLAEFYPNIGFAWFDDFPQRARFAPTAGPGAESAALREDILWAFTTGLVEHQPVSAATKGLKRLRDPAFAPALKTEYLRQVRRLHDPTTAAAAEAVLGSAAGL